MPKYLVQNTYTADGMRGLLAEGGSSRRDAAVALVESLGGTLESFYFASGGSEVISVVDLPDNASAVAATGTILASGAAGAPRVTALITAEEVDGASAKVATYRPPGA